MTPERARALELNWKALLTEINKRARLLVVSKTRPVDEIRYLYQLGQRDFGENRVQELEEKALPLSDLPDLRWHLIGPLQSNKVGKLKKIVGLSAIHSVGTLALIGKIQSAVERPLDIYLQVNTSREDAKSGFEDFPALQEAAKAVSGPLRLKGLMTMATLRTEDPVGEARRCFRELRGLRDQLDPGLELSMGMSGDYPIALEEGAHWVRVGGKVFA